ncbi:MAG TPA: hypothetical protein VGO71_14650 [Baekduia sp.]|jgi:hypothetical protein|nr:hypothetical protein [Baekduia sp.]
MHQRPAGPWPVAQSIRRALPTAAVVLASAVVAGPAWGDTTVNVVGDSVIVTDPPSGPATVEVTRPDALTGRPVVIGYYSGTANGPLPLTVNTTTSTPLSPNGDCWQQGALSQALTPDIRPGDTVTVAAQPGPFGTPAPASVRVPADGPPGSGGPIPSCASVAPFAQNAVTAAPSTIGGGPLTVSGVAQPLATDLAATVTDGHSSTAPVHAAPAADGTWSATIPADQVGALAAGTLTITPVFAVPDVATGAAAHIAGVPISLQLAPTATPSGDAGSSAAAAPQGAAPGAAPSAGSAPPQGGPSSGPASMGGATPGQRVSGIRVQSPISLARARAGLRPSFVVPAGARVIDVRLLLGRRTIVHRVVSAGPAGKRQTVALSGRTLRRGRYTLAVRSGISHTRLRAPVLWTIRVR